MASATGTFTAPQAKIFEPDAVELALTQALASPETSWWAGPMVLNARGRRADNEARYFSELDKVNQLANALAQRKLAQENMHKAWDVSAGLAKEQQINPGAFAPLQVLIANDPSARADIAQGVLGQRFKTLSEAASNFQSASKAGTEAGTPFVPGQLSAVLKDMTGVGVNSAIPLDVQTAEINAAGDNVPRLRLVGTPDGLGIQAVVDKLPIDDPETARRAGVAITNLNDQLARDRVAVRQIGPVAQPTANTTHNQPKESASAAPAGSDPQFTQKVRQLLGRGWQWDDSDPKKYRLIAPDGTVREYRRVQQKKAE